MKQNRRMTQNGFTMILALVAVLVLFTAITLFKVGTLDGINPDLQRIGINTGGQENHEQSIAQLPSKNAGTTLPDPNVTPNPENSLEIASSSFEGDEGDLKEGDNPTYIE